MAVPNQEIAKIDDVLSNQYFFDVEWQSKTLRTSNGEVQAFPAEKG